MQCQSLAKPGFALRMLGTTLPRCAAQRIAFATLCDALPLFRFAGRCLALTLLCQAMHCRYLALLCFANAMQSFAVPSNA